MIETVVAFGFEKNNGYDEIRVFDYDGRLKIYEGEDVEMPEEVYHFVESKGGLVPLYGEIVDTSVSPTGRIYCYCLYDNYDEVIGSNVKNTLTRTYYSKPIDKRN